MGFENSVINVGEMIQDRGKKTIQLVVVPCYIP